MNTTATRESSAGLDALLAAGKDRRLLVRGATIISMDPEVGDLPRGDLLIEGSRITAVGPDLMPAARDNRALVVDADGMIAIPGLHDTHRHSWQTQLRRLLPDCSLFEYVELLHGRLAPVYRPQDMYLGNRLAALTALQSGITTVLDFAHNRRTVEHGDEALRAWQDAGVRASFVPVAPLFGEWDGGWRNDLRRLRETSFASDDQLIRLRVGAYAKSVPDLVVGDLELSAETAELAHDLGLGITVDAVFGELASAHLERLANEGVLSSNMTFIHCTRLSTAAWDGLAEAGSKVALAATSDAMLGCEDAVPPIQEALDRGIDPGLSIDVEACLSSDLYTQMRTVLAVQRMQAQSRRHRGETDVPPPLSTRAALHLATVAGATANGWGDVTGSLTPGKQADVVLIRANDFDNLPLNNAVATVVLGTDTGHVDTVFVAGEPRKWGGKLVGANLARLRAEVEESRDWLLEQVDRPLNICGD
ncbi:amidohydrolase family protein [Streptomyces chartreusis]|uniref:amidohydrolase family protein n=1 Tax=Streptomyces chartreusis TaxID=1969 RepID=UPI003681C8BC